jgi:hypothetical protein
MSAADPYRNGSNLWQGNDQLCALDGMSLVGKPMWRAKNHIGAVKISLEKKADNEEQESEEFHWCGAM